MRTVLVGEITGSYGVRGWVKVRSYTDPPGSILRYTPWLLERKGRPVEYPLIDGKPHGGNVIALLQGIENPEQARELRGSRILVDRAVFPPAEPGNFYWVDLVGLNVKNLNGQNLGRVEDLMATGANDVLIVRGDRERLIPFLTGATVRSIDLQAGEILVDWDEAF